MKDFSYLTCKKYTFLLFIIQLIILNYTECSEGTHLFIVYYYLRDDYK